MNTSLVWSPVHHMLEERIKLGDNIILLIVPFIKVAALQQLHRVQTQKVQLKVVCRWRTDDLLSGASDVEVFTYLKAAGCQLYLHPDIHMKLYVFDSNIAFNTSANLTFSGLGYSQKSNIEVGNMVKLNSEDLTKIYTIVATSRQVDDDMYLRFKTFVEQNELPRLAVATFDFLGKPKAYTISSLPATESPEQLAEFYFDPDPTKYTPENVRRGVHDLVTFGLPPGLNRTEFDRHLGEAFRNTPFVAGFVELLKQQTSLRFGAVNDWIHQKCEDVPLPYRWEIKENTRIFYDWLAHYIPAIASDRTHHSQVIYWKNKG